MAKTADFEMAIDIGVTAFVFLRTPGSTQLAIVSGPGYSVAYPDTWSVESPPSNPTDVVLLIRQRGSSDAIDPGLVLRRNPNDPYPVVHDVPALQMANRFSFPHLVVLRQGQVAIHGLSDAYMVVSGVSFGGRDERILDIVIRTPRDTVYHLQAIAPANVLTDATIKGMATRLSVTD